MYNANLCGAYFDKIIFNALSYVTKNEQKALGNTGKLYVYIHP